MVLGIYSRRRFISFLAIYLLSCLDSHLFFVCYLFNFFSFFLFMTVMAGILCSWLVREQRKVFEMHREK